MNPSHFFVYLNSDNLKFLRVGALILCPSWACGIMIPPCFCFIILFVSTAYFWSILFSAKSHIMQYLHWYNSHLSFYFIKYKEILYDFYFIWRANWCIRNTSLSILLWIRNTVFKNSFWVQNNFDLEFFLYCS